MMKIKNKIRNRAVYLVIIGGISSLVMLGMVFASQPAASESGYNKVTGLNNIDAMVKSNSNSHLPVPFPPEPKDQFSITVNGHPEVTTFAVKRGQTAQFDVLIAPMISGITGNVYVHSIKPVCGTINVAIGCIPSGITASLSENTVSNAKHLVLTMTVPANMPVGRYGYEITVGTHIDSFNIQVT